MTGYAYVAICLFDFIVVPCWYGLTRPNIAEIMLYLPEGDLAIQLEYMRVLTDQHSPYTLQYGGLIHLAFGALLTGSVINRFTKKD